MITIANLKATSTTFFHSQCYRDLDKLDISTNNKVLEMFDVVLVGGLGNCATAMTITCHSYPITATQDYLCRSNCGSCCGSSSVLYELLL